MRSVFYIAIIFTLFLSCQKNRDSETGPDLQGSYTGSFNRSGMTDTARVSISLSETNFEGQSDIQKYPAICRGSYTTSENSISFVDSCAWTADFDWTLILNGTYNLSLQPDNTIRIWRTNGVVTDEYILQKRFR
jgi:hypothetical protein